VGRITTTIVLIAALLLGACSGDDSPEPRAEPKGSASETPEDTASPDDESLEEMAEVVDPATRSDTQDFKLTTPEIEEFLTLVLEDNDEFWTETFLESGLNEPFVQYLWVPEGERYRSRCRGQMANDQSAFYCPVDDTIYIGLALGEALFEEAGDFALAYIVSHEMGHSIQQELGILDYYASARTVKRTELQADCMAGVWGYSTYVDGYLESGDVTEARTLAYRIGDFDSFHPQHHGTPKERKDAWLLGYESGMPSVCAEYAPVPG
jgi:uncharacterized protein